jgi:hypothetical protein
MSRVIVIHWEPGTLRATVVHPTSGRAEVEAVMEVPWDDGDDDAVGRKLAEVLDRYSPSRARVVVSVSRQALAWQHLSLPPCPDEDLPDLVRLQSDYNHSSSGDLVGLDFLPLSGDAQMPHRVWAISLSQARLTKLHRMLRAAELKNECLVPLALGWAAWARHSAAAEKQKATIWVAPQGAEPTIWATVGGRVVLFRQVQLPRDDAAVLAAAVANELRRTLLAFSQEQPQAGDPRVQLVGDRWEVLAQLADELGTKLQRKVQAVKAETAVAGLGQDGASEVSLPTLGLALDEAAGNAPLVDLLHPRRRPPPRTSRRTYALAATAAASLAALVGWQGYANLQAPLTAAETAQAEIQLLQRSSDAMREYEQRASSIRGWLANSVNLLDELGVLSNHVRPEPLNAESFPADDDVVVGKVVLQNRQFTIDALAKENRDVQPLENRLRDGVHRVQRGKTEPSDALPGYPLAFQSIVDVTDAAASGEATEP